MLAGGLGPVHVALLPMLHGKGAGTGSVIRRFRVGAAAGKCRLRPTQEIPREAGTLAKSGSGDVAGMPGCSGFGWNWPVGRSGKCRPRRWNLLSLIGDGGQSFSWGPK